MTDEQTDHARAALWGLAIGDALGMPTQMMSHDEVTREFGELDGFQPAGQGHPIAAGMSAGSVTDDTEQAILLAQEIIAGSGHVDPTAFAHALVAWENTMRTRGSLDLLGPSTRAALEAVIGGAPLETSGRFGVTNGAAMRVVGVGISFDGTNVAALIDRVVEASFVTHNTGVAIAGASAVAAAVSAGINGATVREAIEAGVSAAEAGETRGFWAAAASVARRIELAVKLANPENPHHSLCSIRELIGTSLATQESVPAAFGILTVFPDDPWAACTAAARQGGDSDTIAAMVGAVSGACQGMQGFPVKAVDTVRLVNPSLNVDRIADELLTLRRSAL